jgi:vancomycin resistance protein YoaR
MGKISKKAAWLVLCGLLAVLSGCAGHTAQEEPANGKGQTEQNEEFEKALNETADDEKNGKEAEQEEKKPVTVTVIDPMTKSVIKTIEPDDMDFGEEGGKYQAEIEKWARELARGTETVPGFDQRNTPDRVGENGQVIKGNPRVILEEAEFVEKVLAASEKGGEVELPLYMTASGYQPEDAAHLDEVVVASYTTYFNSGVAGRTKNIELSAQAIHNVIIGEGDYFSFNTTVGPSDEKHGYQPAEEAINGKLVMGIGGGICQTSSTLFNAVDQLGVDYVEKHHHSVTVGYVPAGRDATVSYGGKDFRFQNTTGAPFLLRSVFENGKLTIEVRTSKQYEGVLKKGI